VGSVYRLDCLGWNTNGTRAGAKSWNIVRLGTDPLQFTVRWIGTAGRSYQAFLFNPDGSGAYTGASIPGVNGAMEAVFMAPGTGPFRLYVRDSVDLYEYWNGTMEAGATLLSAPFGAFDLGTLAFTY
jgi:hypothetical protein